MSIHDIFSNYKPTIVDAATLMSVGATTSFTNAIDLSAGQTTLLTYTMVSGIGFNATVTVQFSADEAFSNPIDNPDEEPFLGNRIILADGTELTKPQNSFGFDEFYAIIVNPVATYRYARLKFVGEAGNGGTTLLSIQKTGPQRFVAAE